MEIDQLIAAGLPSPMMPSPLLSENEEVPKNSQTTITTGEPVKQEKPDQVEDESQLYNGKFFWKMIFQEKLLLDFYLAFSMVKL